MGLLDFVRKAGASKATSNKPVEEEKHSAFAKHSGSGVCEVCIRSISPGEAYLVPVNIFY